VLMAIPPVTPDGVRQTVNAGITPAQTMWNVRSAFNVAALNCLSPQHVNILPNYKAFLENFDRPLDKANDKVEAEFREKFGDRRTGRAELDSYMTKVYNYFTLPPAKVAFCDAALELSNESVLVAPADLDSFAARAMTRFEAVFEDFFRAFERYETSVAAWDRQYGPPQGLYPSYGSPTHVASSQPPEGDAGTVLLGAPSDEMTGNGSGTVQMGAQTGPVISSDPMLAVPQDTQTVEVAPSTAEETMAEDTRPVIVLPQTAATGTPDEAQGPVDPDSSGR